MRKLEWPGIATAVGIILILALIMLGARDDFHLKDWQTVIASVVALTGGALAYVSATAKVQAEKDSERRELERKKLGAYYRLGFALTQLLVDSQKIVDRTEYKLFATPEAFSAADVQLSKPPEIDDVWPDIEIFPKKAITDIHCIRVMFRDMEAALKLVPADYQAKRLMARSDTHFGRYLAAIDMLRGACQRTAQELNDAISELEAAA